jgi:alpha-L-fucosidase
MKYGLFALLLAAALPMRAQQHAATSDLEQKMQWFADAKLGIFIHAGIYSVKGVDESWSFYNKKISHAEYMQQLEGFTLRRYNPAAWADLIQQSGANYAVITTKHHDGVAMYDTRMNRLSSVHATPARQDMVAPLFTELRKRNIKTGAYYSLIDWTHPDYPAFLKDSNRYEIKNDPARWNRFRRFFQGQIDEIGQQLNPISGGSTATGNTVLRNGKPPKSDAPFWPETPPPSSTGDCKATATMPRRSRIFRFPDLLTNGGNCA